jgi:predicted nucleotidyltransferase
MTSKGYITKAELIETLTRHNKDIRIRFKVKDIGLFGSYVRGEQKKESDVDVLVEFEKGYKTFNNYMDLKFFLEDIFGLKVDLVIKDAVRTELKEYILTEVVYA